jgi:hypothetical protein
MAFKDIVDQIVGVINTGVIPLIFAMTFLLFLVGIVRYFFMGEGEENQTKGKQLITWGLVGFTVMFSLWGIINMLVGILPSAS